MAVRRESAQRGRIRQDLRPAKRLDRQLPFLQPRYHQNLVYDPENIAHSDEKFRTYREELEKKSGALWYSIPDREDEIWARTDLTREEKESAKLRLEVEAAQNPDPEIEEQRRIIDRHKQLAFTNSATAICRSSSRPTASLKKKAPEITPFKLPIPWLPWKCTKRPASTI